MSSISAWVLSIAGVTVISVLIDLFLPDGQTNGHIKNVFSYVMVLVIIAPLPGLIKSDNSFELFFKTDDMVIQDDFIYSINQKKLDALTESIEKDLIEHGIKGVEISISANIFDTKMQIDAVFVNLSNLVINSNNENIDIVSEIKETVTNYISIKEDKIFINE